jgi:hypothetical protein
MQNKKFVLLKTANPEGTFYEKPECNRTRLDSLMAADGLIKNKFQ